MVCRALQLGDHYPDITTLLRTTVPTTECPHFLVPSLPSRTQAPWPLLPTAGITWPTEIHRLNPALVSGQEGVKDVSLEPRNTGGHRENRTCQELEHLDFSCDLATYYYNVLDVSEFSRLHLEMGAVKNICLPTSVEVGRSSSVIWKV